MILSVRRHFNDVRKAVYYGLRVSGCYDHAAVYSHVPLFFMSLKNKNFQGHHSSGK